VGPGPGHAPVAHAPAPRPADLPAPWGALIAVRRDGTDGERHALSGDWVDIGREGDLAFEDRYLAARHARLERAAGGVRLTVLDPLNGAYRRLRAATPAASGSILLVGRELLRLDLVESDERDVVPAVRHGVTMFGSPPRKPWGRLSQLLANGGVRDVYHVHLAEAVIGREEGELVFRDDEFLSRRHAVLRWNGSQCMVEDLRSSNGTFLRIRGAVTLEAGDTIRLGDQMFRFEPS
jgi:hypothetical protein